MIIFIKLLTPDNQGALFNCVYSLYMYDWNIQGAYSVTCRCKCIITAVGHFIVPFYMARKHSVVLLLDQLLMLIHMCIAFLNYLGIKEQPLLVSLEIP